MNDGVGRQLADHLLNVPSVSAGTARLKCGARKATSLGDTARRWVELAVDLVHAGDPTNGDTVQNRPTSLRKAHRTGELNLETALLY